MVAPAKPVTSEQFEQFILRPENAQKRFELVGGVLAGFSLPLEKIFR